MGKIKEFTDDNIELVEDYIVSIGLKYKNRRRKDSDNMDKLRQLLIESEEKNLNIEVDR